MTTDPTHEAMRAAKRIEKAALPVLREYQERFRQDYARIIDEEFAAVRRIIAGLLDGIDDYWATTPHGKACVDMARNALNGDRP